METKTKRIKCGGCKGYHESLEIVKACCLGEEVDPALDLAYDAEGAYYEDQSSFQAQRAAARQEPPATERQRAFLHTLAAERPAWADVNNVHSDVIDRMTKQQASSFIKQALEVPKENAGKPSPGKALFVTNVPEGHYAVDSETGNNDLDFFRVDRPTEGKWEGYTFVKRVVGGHPDYRIHGKEAQAVLCRIEEAGVKEAALRYGKEIGRCCKCNRHLTDETSREFGMGPDCRSQVGW